MKKLRYKTIGLTLVLSLITLFSAFADDQEFTRKFNQSWTCSEATKLLVENKFGDLVVKNTPENNISIEVTITVEASSQEKADKVMDKINIVFSEEGDLKKAITVIEENLNAKGLSIDWIINVPVYLDMDLKNRYGNINIDENHGKTNLEVKYGKLIAGNLLYDDSKPLNMITVTYGKAFITKLTRAKVQMGYSDLNVEEAAAIILTSKYSDIEIDKIKALVAESKYDEYNVKDVNSMVFIGKYGAIEVEKLHKKADIDVKYTNCEIKNVNPDFSDLKVIFAYGNVDIGISKDASYQLTALGKYGNIDYPDGNSMEVIRETTEWSIKGNIGSNSQPSATVNINGRYGNIDLDK